MMSSYFTTENKILVTKSSMPKLDDFVDEIRDIWDSHWLTNMGNKHQELQKELSEYLDVSYIDLLTNGHMALEMSLQAFNFPEGSEVITSPYTFASTTHAIVRNGLVPVFCDINPTDYTIDVNKIEDLITDKTVAILPIHVYGNICDVKSIDEIAKKHNLKVIYDAAHSFGEKYDGIGVGNFGDVSCFSFHATKVFNTIEGGAVVFKNEEFGENIYRLKNFGIRNEEVVDGIGANAKMNEFCAAMGLCNLRNIDSEIAKRKAVYEKYLELLENVPGIKLNYVQDKLKSNYAYFPILINAKDYGMTRDELKDALDKAGIGARKYFYPITSAFDCYKGRFIPENTPIALETSKNILTLPMYADLELEDVERICNMVQIRST